MAADWLILEAVTHAFAPSSNDARTLLIKVDLVFLSENGNHTGKCIRRFGGIYAYCRYFIHWKW